MLMTLSGLSAAADRKRYCRRCRDPLCHHVGVLFSELYCGACAWVPTYYPEGTREWPDGSNDYYQLWDNGRAKTMLLPP